ncbi:ABC transporter permease [Hoeflea alexandrii]|uniref:ABC transporter permease n=1 Tax=Hoeflea alexandrii TaxID=288436 RepID=UPI0022AF0171|nr:ABC transporter permease [Hoeflea alexandrii]MCZ4290334.1 ABC transporter permease [Hoeflea alexandrii]
MTGFKLLLRRILPQLITLALVVGLISIMFPGFFEISLANGRLYGSPVDIFNRGAPVALLAIGMTLVIATGGIDLSVGAVMAICGAVAAWGITEGYGLLPTLLMALAAGLACGLWNGLLVAFLGIQPIVATLILMVAGRGIAQLITEGAILTFNHEGMIFFGSGSLLTVPTPIIIAILTGALVTLIVRRSALGMLIEAIGINFRASTLAGVNTRVLLVAVYMTSGLCAALAGIIAAADIRGADANNAGLWLELDAILAVVIGGTSLLGGRFSLIASLIGALIIQAVNTGILLSGFPPEFNLIIKAVIILIILVLQSPRVRTVLAFLSTARADAAGQEKKVVEP